MRHAPQERNGKAMSKKNIARTKKLLSPRPAVRPEDIPYLVRDELDEPQRLTKAAASGAGALKAPAPAGTAEPSPIAAAVPAKPLAPLAILWPEPAAPQPAPQPAQSPVQQVQKASAKAATPHASPAPAAQPAKPPIQGEPTQSPGEAALAEKAAKPNQPQSVKVTFVLLDLGAKQVSLCGDFNGWSRNATPMRRDSSGHWETTVDLVPGRYEYKFMVNGEWIPDPLAHENVWNQHGTLNSVVEVRA